MPASLGREGFHLDDKAGKPVGIHQVIGRARAGRRARTRLGCAILNLEGGVGRDFLKGAAAVGLAYYATFKLTEDRFDSRAVELLVRGKNRVWGLGPEVTVPIALKKTVYGFVTARYQWEMGARTTTEGGAWNVLATVLLKPLRAPQP